MPLIDAKTLAAELHLTPKFVRRLAQQGKIPAERYGSEWRFDVEQVRKASQYVDRVTASAHAAARRIWLKPKRRVV